MPMRFSILSLAVLGFGLSSAPAWGGAVLFSDLGAGSSVYAAGGSAIVGSGNANFPGTEQGLAMPFTVAGVGGELVSQIDLAVSNESGTSSFIASIWTDIGGAIGSQISGAFWALATSVSFPNCCGLVTAPVSGVSLMGGQEYFMVLTPVSYSDDSWNVWDSNTQGVTGPFLYTLDGNNWMVVNPDPYTLGAFDVLGDPVPEPTSIFLSATGLAALLALRRRKANL